MAVVRVGAVSYLNARPLVVGLETRPDRFAVRYDLPSTCARLLHARDIDLGLIPSIEYLRGDGYAMVACGGIEVMVDPEVSLWDIAPMPVIIGEAGGRWSTLDGSEPRLEPGAQPSFVATNGLVHDHVIAALNATGA